MKKAAKIAILAVAALCLLTGCYKQESTIKVSPFGGIKADISFVGTDAAVSEVSGGMSYDDLMENLVPQIEQMITDPAKASVEKISETAADGSQMNGLRFKASYGSAAEMFSNSLFGAYNSSVAVPVVSDLQNGQSGIKFEAKSHWYGTEYFVNGTISLTQGQTVTDEEMANLSGATAKFSFKFPFTSFTSSKGSKNFLVPTFAYTADTTTGDVPVSFYVFTPNMAMLLALLIIIGLIIAIVILSRKYKALLASIKSDEETEEADTEEALSADDANFFEGDGTTEEFDNTESEEALEEASEEADDDKSNE